MNPKKSLALPIAIVIGAALIAVAASFHWAAERKAEACERLSRGVNADPGAAHLMISVYAQIGPGDDTLSTIVRGAERFSGVTVQECMER